jgi:hypothetical protein
MNRVEAPLTEAELLDCDIHDKTKLGRRIRVQVGDSDTLAGVQSYLILKEGQGVGEGTRFTIRMLGTREGPRHGTMKCSQELLCFRT